ncbi:heterokaryon incompatibility protein-domain-containing protein [Nemania abortiva]|nr:heterokaryon incompatibility protein-domain-containing protein [Nemania abortiva]
MSSPTKGYGTKLSHSRWRSLIYIPSLTVAFIAVPSGIAIKLATGVCAFALSKLHRNFHQSSTAFLLRGLATVSEKIYEYGYVLGMTVLGIEIAQDTITHWVQKYLRHREYQQIRRVYYPYRYKELTSFNPKTIRLIELLPKGKDGDVRSIPRVKFHLATLDNLQDLKYEALSYCWGNKTPLHPVLCDASSVVWVTQNLFDALQELRLEDRSRMLWADAICINQTHVPEKNIQVQMMAEIYTHAERVLVWLGKAADRSETLEHLIPALLKAKDLAAANGYPDEEAPRTLSSDELAELGIIKIDDFDPSTDGLRALHAIYLREWWTRVWVIQEFLLAKECILCCGSWSIPWASFDAAYDFAEDLFTDNDAMGSRFRSQRRVLSLFKAELYKYPSNLAVMMALCAASKVSDPRDRVYAMLGLAIRGNEIVVDYTKSVEQVYTEAMLLSMRTNPSLTTVLRSSGITDDMEPSTPSWTPKRFDARSIAWDMSAFMSPDATGGSKYEFKLDGKVLRMEGYELDVIMATGCRGPPVMDPGSEAFSIIPRMLLMCADGAKISDGLSNAKYGPTGEPNICAFFQTIMGPTREDSYENQLKQFKYLEPELRLMKAAVALPLPYDWLPCRILALGLFDILGIPAHFRKFFTGEPLGVTVSLFRCCGRRVARTVKGGIGLVPQEAKPGDTIFLLRGFDAPYVLRKTKGIDDYLLVGECYLHGYMDGREWDATRCLDLRII